MPENPENDDHPDDDAEIIPDIRGMHEAVRRGWVVVDEDRKVTITEKGFEVWRRFTSAVFTDRLLSGRDSLRKRASQRVNLAVGSRWYVASKGEYPPNLLDRDAWENLGRNLLALHPASALFRMASTVRRVPLTTGCPPHRPGTLSTSGQFVQSIMRLMWGAMLRRFAAA